MTERTDVLRSTLPLAALLRFDDAGGGPLDRPARPVLDVAVALMPRELATSLVSSP